jgi:hypothetical protein
MVDQNIAYAAGAVTLTAQQLAQEISSYHATWYSALKPVLSKDGDKWCALYGENLQEGVSGFGDTPAAALLAFEVAMHKSEGHHIA